MQAWRAGRPGPFVFTDGTRSRVGELHPGVALQFLHAGEVADDRVPDGPGLILRALGELSRHQLARVDSAPSSKASRQAARRAGAGGGVRRLYLQRPEEGTLELEALRAERAHHAQTAGGGADRAAHWVRGHWKRQWHPSTDEHRWTYVQGYPRGAGVQRTSAAAEAGRVLLARGTLV